MNLLIIGHSVVDHVVKENGESISPGGIFYSSLAFNAVKKNDDRMFLLTSIDDKDYDLFEELYSGFDLSYVNPVNLLPHVNIQLSGRAERRAHYVSFVGPLNYDKINDWNQFDGIFINMVTGEDLYADDFIKIRNNFNGKIYLDVHTLSRGKDKDNHRFFRKIPEYKKYLRNVNIVQVNEHELLSITPYDKFDEIVSTVFKLGVEILIVTKGDKGAGVYTKEGKEFNVNALNLNSVNKIGCGDVFGSVFFYKFMETGNISLSLDLANRAAGMITTYSNNNEMKKLRYDLFERFA